MSRLSISEIKDPVFISSRVRAFNFRKEKALIRNERSSLILYIIIKLSLIILSVPGSHSFSQMTCSVKEELDRHKKPSSPADQTGKQFPFFTIHKLTLGLCTQSSYKEEHAETGMGQPVNASCSKRYVRAFEKTNSSIVNKKIADRSVSIGVAESQRV